MSEVRSRPGESFESLMRRFKKSVERSGVLAEYKKHEAYEKPSVKLKRKQAAARKRDMKRMKKLERFQDFKGKRINFKFNKDKTEKIYLSPKKPKQFVRNNNQNRYSNPNRDTKENKS